MDSSIPEQELPGVVQQFTEHGVRRLGVSAIKRSCRRFDKVVERPAGKNRVVGQDHEGTENSERANVWQTAKRLLNQDAYAAMWLRYVEDMSIKEVSRALDKKQSWAKVTLLRGRRALSAELSDGASAASRSENYGRI